MNAQNGFAALMIATLAIMAPQAQAQTERTRCTQSQNGRQLDCTTRSDDRNRFELELPDPVGSFREGRRQAQRDIEMELRAERLRLDNQLLQQQLEQQQRQQQSQLQAQQRANATEEHVLRIMRACNEANAEMDPRRQCLAQQYVADPVFARALDGFFEWEKSIQMQALKNDLVVRVAKLNGLQTQ